MSLIFRGTHASTIAGGNLLINGVEKALLPSRTSKTVKVAGRAGAYDFGTEEDVGQFVVTATLTAGSETELESNIEDIQKWLHGEKGEIIFDSRPQVSYFGKVVGNTDYQRMGTSAFISFTLECADPHGYGIEKEYVITETEDMVDVINDGNAETFPSFSAQILRSAPSLIIANGDKHVLLGKPQSVEQTTKPRRELIFKDEMIDPNLWTTASNIDGGVVRGTFASNGSSFTQKDKDYGTGSGYHGAAMSRSFITPVKDFEVTAEISLQSNSRNQLGRVELYLLDINGVHIGKIGAKDIFSGYTWQQVEARAGALSTGKYFFSDYVGSRGHWQKYERAVLQISRKTALWTMRVALKNAGGREVTIAQKHYIDVKSNYLQDLAGVQLHVGAFGTSPIANDMAIYKVQAHKINPLLQNEVNMTFNAGDVVEVDNASAKVILNGTKALDILDASSDFFSIGSGKHAIGVYPMGVSQTRIKFNNRYK